MSYEQLSASVDALAVINADLKTTVLAVQTGAMLARDDAEAFAINALGYVAQTQALTTLAQQAVLDATTNATTAAQAVLSSKVNIADQAISVSSKRFVANGDDDTGTPFAKYKVERTHTGTTSPHAFRDETIFTPPTANQAACSYDAALDSTGTQAIDHTIGFQSRNTHNGSGVLAKFYGAGSFNISYGPVTSQYSMYAGDKSYGTVGSLYGFYNRPGLYSTAVNVSGMVHYPALNAGSAVTNSTGVRIEAADGTGTLTNEFGIYIKPFVLGTNKYPIYIEPTTGKNYIGAKTQIDQTLEVGGSAKLTLGGLTSSDYPAITYNYDPRLNQYIASTEASGFQWGATNFIFRHALTGTAGATPTFSTLLNIHTANDANKGALFPGGDGTQSLGLSGAKWKEVRATEVRPGAGSVIWTSGTGTPEAVVTAPIGSMFTRTDGGANTTLYVKESGTGSTGWIAK